MSDGNPFLTRPNLAPGPATTPFANQLPTWWLKVEERLDAGGDRLSPILIKEARQAMKSRQFTVTFALLLIVGWLWTVMAIVLGMPEIFYTPWGPFLLSGYFVVLSIPLFVVIPFAAFRSLAAETEDGTFELLSITTLTAWQIVLGKLGSAILQMLVYFSALAPCIAFTYLLRGIDVLTIGFLLGYAFLGSLMLSIFSLLLATVSRSRQWQILLSVVLIGLLLLATFMGNMLMGSWLNSEFSTPFDSPAFWWFNGYLIAFVAAYGTLFMQIAAAQISFASENRSSTIRFVLVLIQFLMTAAYITAAHANFDSDEWLTVMVSILGLHTTVVGLFMCAENAQLSPRARRELPQSLLGRSLLTWFNPGSGSGYVFCVLNLAAVIVLRWVWTIGEDFFIVSQLQTRRITWNMEICVAFDLCVLGYVALYLGLGRLIVQALRYNNPQFSMLTGVLLQFVLIVFGLLLPLLITSIEFAIGQGQPIEYSIWQLPNWIWTSYEVLRPGGTPALGWMIGLLGAVVFSINFFTAAHEAQEIRRPPPKRVVEDDIAHSPHLLKPRNPWTKEAAS